MTKWLKVSIRIVILWREFNSLLLIHVQIFKDTCYTWRPISSKFLMHDVFDIFWQLVQRWEKQSQILAHF